MKTFLLSSYIIAFFILLSGNSYAQTSNSGSTDSTTQTSPTKSATSPTTSPGQAGCPIPIGSSTCLVNPAYVGLTYYNPFTRQEELDFRAAFELHIAMGSSKTNAVQVIFTPTNSSGGTFDGLGIGYLWIEPVNKNYFAVGIGALEISVQPPVGQTGSKVENGWYLSITGGLGS